MKVEDVPQDDNPSLGQVRKVAYAEGADGRLVPVATSGWNVEETVTRQAVAEFQRLADEAATRAALGEASALEVHMYRHRLDPPTLAQMTGLWLWRVRRHLRPDVFPRLPPQLLARYASVMGLSADALRKLPDNTTKKSP